MTSKVIALIKLKTLLSLAVIWGCSTNLVPNPIRTPAQILEVNCHNSLINLLAPRRNNPLEFFGLEENSTFLDSAYSIPFLKKLRQITFAELSKSEKDKIKDALDQFSKRIDMTHIQWGIFRNRDSKSDELVFAGIFKQSEGNPIGFWSASLRLDRGEAELDFVKIERKNPFSKGLFKKWYEEYSRFLKNTQIKIERLQADWSGRGLWAHLGYEFDPNFMFNVQGRKMSQITLIKENFIRFLKMENIEWENLSIDGRPLLESDLTHPDNYLKIKSVDNRKIQTRPYVDYMVWEEMKEMEVGMSFVNKFYGAEPSEKIVILDEDGDQFSTTAMPYWKAIRVINPSN